MVVTLQIHVHPKDSTLYYYKMLGTLILTVRAQNVTNSKLQQLENIKHACTDNHQTGQYTCTLYMQAYMRVAMTGCQCFLTGANNQVLSTSGIWITYNEHTEFSMQTK